MAIKATLIKEEFVERFRQIRPDDFSRPALRALFDWYEELSDSTGEDIKFDAIAIRCEWAEYNSIEEVRADYDWAEDVEDLNGVIADLEEGGVDAILVRRANYDIGHDHLLTPSITISVLIRYGTTHVQPRRPCRAEDRPSGL